MPTFNDAAMKRLLILAALIFIPLGSSAFSQAPDCMMCHGNQLSMIKNGKAVSLFVDSARLKKSVHGQLPCASCHVGFNPMEIPHAKPIKPVQCQTCHANEGFEKSPHAVVGCKGCHGAHDVQKVKNSAPNPAELCGQCHKEELQHFSNSAHGQAIARGDRNALSCITCHGSHQIAFGAASDVLARKKQETKLCLKCHLDNAEIRDRVGYSAGFISSYDSSVHGVALASGNRKSATCVDCHGSHDEKKAIDSSSSVNKRNISETCSRCHPAISKEFSSSIHGEAIANGKSDAPTCTTCHGEHQMYAAKDPRSKVSPQNVSVQVCGTCHNSLPLSEKYGIPAGQVASFSDSFHGLASRSGSMAVANCASCHGYHGIRPSSDPRSAVNKANLAATCGKCHPGANENFAKGAVHVTDASKAKAPILYWIRIIYLILIVGVIGAMFFHNLLDFIRKTAHRFAARQGKIPPAHHGATQYVRMTLNQRIQHALMFSSFILLAITGFMLRFPDSWWVIPIREMSERFFEVRSLVHRIAAAALIGISIYHLLYIVFFKMGRRFIFDMFPRFKDVKDVWGNCKYLVGLSKTKPLFDRFSYVEKAEYWALIWGVFVMAGTGIIMWFDNYFMALLTKLGWDVSRTIHFYEACLATLAILVWHFYFVILSPSIYPMSTAWITGKISEEEMEDEHPLELQRLKNGSDK